MKRIEIVLKWVCGIVATVWLASFGALWILRPIPRLLWEFSLAALAVFCATSIALWIVALIKYLGEDPDTREFGIESRSFADEARGQRPGYIFLAWWFGLAIMAWFASNLLFPIEYVTVKDVFLNVRVGGQLLASIVVSWVAARLLFAAADRGWVA